MEESLSISLPYDKGTVNFSIPAKKFLGFITPRTISPLRDIPQAIESALNSPINFPSFDAFLEKGDKVAIIVSDLTRYTGAHLFLPHLITRMSQRGISEKDISLVFALGIHRPLTSEEQKKIVGEEVAGSIQMENHDINNHDTLVTLGKTRRGTPVTINRRIAEADKVILTGTIGFHYLAGFGGGRKSIIPGVASYDGCVATHLLVLNPEKPGRHPQARTGNLKGNPMHEDMMEVCRALPPKFLFNTVLSPEYDILFLAAGHWETAFYSGCQFIDHHFKIPIPQPADLVIVSCGGFPRDINFIQSHKTFDYAMNALRPEGVMILVAACSEGVGHPDFYNWLQFDNLQEMESHLRERFQINGQTVYATLLKAKKANVFLLSELPEPTVQAMSMTPVHSIEDALSRAYQVLGKTPSTYVIPHGSVVLPWAGKD
ncbi:MAG: nickel-dependent lactate racemase [Pseudomonadota bacterium]